MTSAEVRHRHHQISHPPGQAQSCGCGHCQSCQPEPVWGERDTLHGCHGQAKQVKGTQDPTGRECQAFGTRCGRGDWKQVGDTAGVQDGREPDEALRNSALELTIALLKWLLPTSEDSNCEHYSSLQHGERKVLPKEAGMEDPSPKTYPSGRNACSGTGEENVPKRIGGEKIIKEKLAAYDLVSKKQQDPQRLERYEVAAFANQEVLAEAESVDNAEGWKLGPTLQAHRGPDATERKAAGKDMHKTICKDENVRDNYRMEEDAVDSSTGVLAQPIPTLSRSEIGELTLHPSGEATDSEEQEWEQNHAQEAKKARKSEAVAASLSHPIFENLNTRVFTDGVRGLHDRTRLTDCFAAVTLLVFVGWPYIFLTFIGFCWSSKAIMLFVLFGFCSLCLPAKLLWRPFAIHRMFAWWRRYFQFSYLFEQEEDIHENKILALFPHGAFPLGPIMTASFLAEAMSQCKIHCVAASSVFMVPYWRHIFTWLGVQPASTYNMRRLLKQGHVGVLVGGIAEMYLLHQEREQIKLSDRKGFVRLAVQEGADIIPLYYFGASRILSFGPTKLQALCRKMRYSFGILYGRCYTLIPRKIPIFTVIGKSIEVKQMSADSPEFSSYVDEVHARVTRAVRDLYYQHRDSYGWGDRPLEIL